MQLYSNYDFITDNICIDDNGHAVNIYETDYAKNLFNTISDGFTNDVIVNPVNDNINDIEKYKGCDLYVTRENAIPLEEGEVYLADIINSKVITEDGEEFGELVDILETGANLVFVVKHDGKEVLLPDIPDCVKEVDDKNKVVTVHIMKGLLDL